MAEHQPQHQLIEQHLARLRASLGSHPGAEDSIEELRDHLLTAVERHEAAGLSPSDAEHRAIAELGDPATIARAYLANPRGRPAVPTTGTRIGGLAAYAAAGGIAWASALWWYGDRVEAREGWGSAAQLWYSLGSMGVLLATWCLVGTAIAVISRHGGLGAAGWAATATAGLGALVSILSWAVPVWATLLAVAWAIVTLATRSARIAPTRALACVAGGFAAMPLLVVASDAAASDGWSGSGIWNVAGPLLGAGAIATVIAGCIGLGRWLSREVPVDIPPTASTATT